MKTVDKLQELSNRLDHLESVSLWIAETVGETDPAVSQSANLIETLAEDVRYRVMELVSELEKEIVVTARLQ